MDTLKAVWKFFDGKKRNIATVAGVVMAWAWKYEVMPEMWLDLGNGLLTLLGTVAVTHGAMKARK